MDRARAYRYDGQAARALDDLDRAERVGGDVSMIALERGLALAELGRDSEAETELTKHLRGPNPKASAYARRAALRERGGRPNEATRDYTAALALAADVEWYLRRGRLQETQGLLNDTAAGLREGLARCTGAVAIRLELLRLETTQGHFESATQLIDEAIAQADVKTEWYLRRADVQAAAGNSVQAACDRKAALAEADRAVARRPTALRLLTRARVFVALGQPEKAATDLRAALRKAPGLVEAAELLTTIQGPTHTSVPNARN
ncbi:MAG TPA: tetratricopeptide repeat protein [Phycisphaerae bacterium]|nr:tetratricopeptide repeat protein [Phycisphaerae bacterium]